MDTKQDLETQRTVEFIRDGAPTPSGPTPPTSFALGRTLGDYHLLRPLGEGGFGEVWLAERAGGFAERVAIKLMKRERREDAIARAWFEQERAALAALRHPNIAGLLGGGEEEGELYFVMEYVEGESSVDYADRRRLTVEERIQLFLPLCDALHHAHLHGIVHRDLKPKNVLVTTIGDRAIPKLIDFGIARVLAGSLGTRAAPGVRDAMAGSPGFMSPEHLTSVDGPLDRRADIYSAGGLLAALLAGVSPSALPNVGEGHLGPSRLVTLVEQRGIAEAAAARRTTPRRLKRLLQGGLGAIIAKSMSPDRQDRYEYATDLAEDLCRWMRSEPVRAKPRSAFYALALLARRRRWGVAVSSTILLALGLGLWSSTTARWEAESSAYAALISSAHAHVLLGDRDAAEAALDACAESDRNHWEWKYLHREIHQARTAYPSQPNDRTDWLAPIAQDGSAFAYRTNASDGPLLVRARLGEMPADRKIEEAAGASWAFSRNGRWMAAVQGDDLLVFDVESGVLTKSRLGALADWTSGRIRSACIGGDGGWVAVTDSSRLVVVRREGDGSSVEHPVRPPNDRFKMRCFEIDQACSEMVVGYDDGSVWRVPLDPSVSPIAVEALPGFSDSPGEQLLECGYCGGDARLIQRTGTRSVTLSHDGRRESIVPVQPSGALVRASAHARDESGALRCAVVFADGRVEVCRLDFVRDASSTSAADWWPIPLSSGDGAITCATWGSGDTLLVGTDRGSVWILRKNARPERKLGHRGEIRAATFSKLADRFLVAGWSGVSEWLGSEVEARPMTLVATQPDKGCVDLEPGELASGLLNLRSRDPVMSRKLEVVPGTNVTSACRSPDGERIAIVDSEGVVSVYRDSGGRALLTLPSELKSKGQYGVHFESGGRSICLSKGTQVVYRWSIE